MFFGRSKVRKSYKVGTPEYDEWIEDDNRSDLEELYDRMKKAGFEGGPGINKDRWKYGDKIFDFENLGGGNKKISNAKLNELTDLLAHLEYEAGESDDDYIDFEEAIKKTHPSNPTGISNPADYMSKITFEKDTDDDGDIDTKVTKTTEDEDTDW